MEYLGTDEETVQGAGRAEDFRKIEISGVETDSSKPRGGVAKLSISLDQMYSLV